MLLKFRTDNSRDPSPQNYTEDSKLLLQIRHDVLESLGVSTDLLPDEFVRCEAERITRALLAINRSFCTGLPGAGEALALPDTHFTMNLTGRMTVVT